jgi:hypothetical protein
MTIRLSMIGSESDADAYLKDLLAEEGKRSMTIIRSHAVRIEDKRLKEYFIGKGREILRTYRWS